MTIRISKTRPVLVRLIIEALSGDSRRQIVAELLKNPEGLSASELARRLDLTISTILTHLDKLIAAGIVRVVPKRRGARIYKIYRIVDEEIELTIDLRLLTSIPSTEELRKGVRELLREIRRERVLPPSFDPETVRDTLRVDIDTALMLTDYLRLNEDEVVSQLCEEAREIFKGFKEVGLRELEEKLRVHTYWALKVARRFEELNEYLVRYD